jgi:Fibronectin type III domain
MRLTHPVRRFTAAALGAAMVASLSVTSASGVPNPRTWFSLDSQLDGGITDTVTVDGVLYVAGWFTEAGGEPAEGVATYDGSAWTPLASGPGFEVESLATDGTNLYAGGAFYNVGPDNQSPGGVAMWDGDSWTDLTSDLPEGTTITALVYDGSSFEAFGFTYVDPQNPSTRTCLAMFMNGAAPTVSWASIGTLTASDCMINDAVISRSGTWIYVVGDFTDVVTGPSSSVTVNGVARWEIGEGWSGYGDGLDFGDGTGSPYAVVEGMTDGDLVVAGALSHFGDPVAVAMWDPDREWTPVDGFYGDDGVVGTELAWDGSDLYLGGYFAAAGDVTMNGITRWDGMGFNPVDGGVTYADGTYAEADSITPYDGTLIVSGDFDKAGNVSAAGVAYYGPATVPGAPRAVKATAGKGSAAVAWSAPLSDGGSAVTSYAVTAAPGGRTCTATAPARTCTVTGLTAGTSYRFTVKATNTVGTGPASASSAAVTALGAASARYVTITTRVLFFAGDSRVGPKGAAALAALKARIPAGAKVTWVKVTGYVQGTTSRYVASDTALAKARAATSAAWLKKHGVGGAYSVGSGGVSGSTGLARAAVVAIRYVVPAA